MLYVIDCGIGNIGSILNMLKHVGCQARRIDDPKDLAAAGRIILPGVGAFDAGMHRLQETGFLPVIQEKARDGVPLLGICLGMQILFDSSEEGVLPGLGLIPGRVRRFNAADCPGLRVPHIGWARATPAPGTALFRGLEENRFYFVHSYHAVCDSAYVAATAWHGYEFPAAVARGNVLGTQFHPEKSHRFGMRILQNFAAFTA